jgi:dienelactone hydrolase
MREYTANSKSAVIVLHEIYGINSFIEDTCAEYHQKGFDVYCPDLLRHSAFAYQDKEKAYEYFYSKAGLDCTEVIRIAKQLGEKYEKVYLLGFSVGATIAWRCCEQTVCDGIVCCYGSRIREYLDLQPKCPVLLIFAEHDAFDTADICRQLSDKLNTEIHMFDACHGFLDRYADCYNEKYTKAAKEYIYAFLKIN